MHTFLVSDMLSNLQFIPHTSAPFRVISRDHFAIDQTGFTDNWNVDRLKLALPYPICSIRDPSAKTPVSVTETVKSLENYDRSN